MPDVKESLNFFSALNIQTISDKVNFQFTVEFSYCICLFYVFLKCKSGVSDVTDSYHGFFVK
jgi:hypothetical protein